MIGFVLTAAAVFFCGLAVSDRLWGDTDVRPAERVLSGAVLGIAVWLAANWTLALAHLLYKSALIGVAAAMAVVALALRPRLPLRASPLVIPIVLWTLFALWKGAVLPPQTHDALAYHLPKAAMIAQAHGFEHFAASDVRITNLPANYEMLVADVFVMTGNDALTEWLGTLSFLVFLCATAAMAERWWGEKAHRAATALAVAGAPFLLLHSSADKNDVMACLFAVTALIWGARWVVHGGRTPMLLLIVSIAIAGGTKPNSGAVFAAIAPFLLLRWRTLRVRGVAATAVAAIVAFLLLGGYAFVDMARHSGGTVAVQVSNVKVGGGLTLVWGDFQNLWQVPYLLLTVPFSTKSNAVWVPWRGQYWYWPHYEIFFSHYGALVTILVILIPFCAWFVREANRERTIATAAALLAAALILPLHLAPEGMFAAMTRYIAFVLPVIACWSVPPLMEILRVRSELIAKTFAGAIAAYFAVSAFGCAVSDRFAPLRFVQWAARHPGTRIVSFMPNRAASVVDRMAGPRDTIAIDGAFDTWSYPAWGPQLSRRVLFLKEGATPADVPAAAQWVVVDRSFNVFWQHPKLTDMSQFWKYVMRGTPSAADTFLLDALRRDPHWALVYYDARFNQAVFQRVSP